MRREMSQIGRTSPALSAFLPQASTQGAGGEDRELPLAAQPFLVVNPHGGIEYGSPGACRLLGSSAHDLKGYALAKLFPALPLRNATPGYNCAYLAFHHPAGRWHAIDAVTHAGRTLRIDTSMLIVPFGHGTRILVGLRGRRQHPDDDPDLRRFLASVDSCGETVVVTDTRGVVEYVNAAYESLSGRRAQDIVGHTRSTCDRSQTSAHPPAQVREQRPPLLTNGLPEHNIHTERTHDGGTLYLDEQVRPFTDRHGHVTHYVYVGRDIGHRVRSELELERRANFDSLTGIANRHLLTERLRQELTRASREESKFTLICADMDRLKTLNDRCGHVAGDSALRTVTRRLQCCVRAMDTVGRIGGDEFLIIAPGLHKAEDVDALLAKLVASVRGLRFGRQSPVDITLSVGAAIYPRDGRDADALIRAADYAMYQAKRSGGDRHWLHSDDDRPASSTSAAAAQMAFPQDTSTPPCRHPE